MRDKILLPYSEQKDRQCLYVERFNLTGNEHTIHYVYYDFTINIWRISSYYYDWRTANQPGIQWWKK